ncbi:MAG TPA: hypothetical protein VK736_05825, partial [Candidatus Binatia bacterium]|nr:hypothetical protein [Candidatus Binatia bacterium]
VDEDMPEFTNPTAITNQLFPMGELQQVVQLGIDGGSPLRVEVTLMPETRTIEWEGRRVETLVSQFISYRDGRILEVTYDYFAQADDGSVWYFGELVDNYGEGRVANHTGAWLAGEDGPPGMIMPAEPQQDDVYHPENIPGVVFEEVTVLETGLVADGPLGEITGAIRVREHLMEGSVEEKIFAPGYGEFQTEASDEFVTVALALPTDAREGDPPAELAHIAEAARLIFDSVSAEDWPTITDALNEITAAWGAMEAGPTPPLLAEQMTKALADLVTAAEGREGDAARQAAVDTAFAASDVAMQYQDATLIDLERMELWARRLIADGASAASVRGDVATLETIWHRVRHAVESADLDSLEEQLAVARAAADANDTGAALAAGEALIAQLIEVRGSAS